MKIFLQQHNDRFINNLANALKNMDQQIQQLDLNKDIYKIYHHYPFNMGIFIASKFTQDIAQFISEYYNSKNSIKFIIYHDILNEGIIDDYGSITTNLIKNDKTYKSAIKIPSLVNDAIFKDLGLERKKNTYAVFLEYTKTIPADLSMLLYPNTKKHIRLFNSPHIQHHQNIGLLSESDKAQILNTYEYFININDEYVEEALSCGAKVVDSRAIDKKMPNKKNKNTISYESFIGSTIL